MTKLKEETTRERLRKNRLKDWIAHCKTVEDLEEVGVFCINNLGRTYVSKNPDLIDAFYKKLFQLNVFLYVPIG